MNKPDKAMQGQTRHWVGIDWGRACHAVSVVDDQRALLTQFVAPATLEGLEGLCKRLKPYGAIAGIAIEATADPIVGFLAVRGFTLYLINPKLSKNWRESNSVAGVKSDARDGRVLAEELARRHESLRTFVQDDPAVARSAGLCEGERVLIGRRTALVQQLQSVLRQYYPGVLPFFSDWTSPAAWRFIVKFSTPKTLARTRKNTLIAFLKANQIGLKPIWLERIDGRGNVTAWPEPPNSEGLQMLALATAKELLSLQPCIEQCERRIEECAQELPQVELMRSLPGAGPRLAPALAAIMMMAQARGNDLEMVRGVSGVAPVEDSSGKRRKTRMRRRCNKHWRNTLHLFARCSMMCCTWAKAFYDLRRERGDSYATALRKLADKWLKIIHRMLLTNEPYDEQRYLEALRKNGSPVYQRLCGKTCA